MTRLPVLIMVAVLAAAPRASAACRPFGTQLECEMGGTRVVIGTQAAQERSSARSLPIRSFHGETALPDDHASSRHAFDVELQDFGSARSLCRKIGNETYCY